MVIFSRYLTEGEPTTCRICGRVDTSISEVIGVCADCLAKEQKIGRLVREVHDFTRSGYSLPPQPPHTPGGRRCRICVNGCSMGEAEKGFCGLRTNSGGHLVYLAGTAREGMYSAYHDSLPTNCVGDWVCPGGTDCGYPDYSYRKGPEFGYFNLAVFLVGCTFDCIFCQNWTFRDDIESMGGHTDSPEDLASLVDERTACICYFGGDPSPQLPFAIRASELALERNSDRILRICWETNGSMHPGLMRRALELSLDSGGCMKFDLKAWDERLHRVLTGITNKRTLENFERAVELSGARPEPPPVIASTLLVPGYVDIEQVRGIARFLSSLDPSIPYSLLAFHPDFYMRDMCTTTREQAESCLATAKEEGLERVRIGNIHLLR